MCGWDNESIGEEETRMGRRKKDSATVPVTDVTKTEEVKAAEDVVKTDKIDNKKVASELVGEQLLKATIDEADYDILKAISKKYWIITNLELLENCQIQVCIAYGKTVVQGKVIVPADFDTSNSVLLEVADNFSRKV